MGRKRYRPDYKKKYPGVEISPEVMKVLTTTDRAMEYSERDRKQETFVVDQEAEIAYFIPAREDSLERLMEEQYLQFPAPGGFENAVLAKIMVDELLSKLPAEESALIRAVELEGVTEEEYGKIAGVCQGTVSKRKARIIEKLRKI